MTAPMSETESKDVLAALEKKRKLREDLKSISGDLDIFYKKLVGDDDSLKKIAKKKLLKITPENVIQI
jgi:hypothetical protein